MSQTLVCRAPLRRTLSAYGMAVAALTLAGLALRIAGARGELWLDEIWSLQNLAPLTSPGEIFYAISQDNNHPLNSLWLWIAGPDASSVRMRAASILFGAASIPLAAAVVRRHAGEAGGLVAGALVALGYAFIHYGSEARGYAGMLFFLLAAMAALDRLIDDPADERARLAFGAVVALGALSNLSILGPVGVLCAAAVARRAPAEGLRVTGFALRLGAAAMLGAAPALASVAAGALCTGHIRIGDQHPFSLVAQAEGLAAILRATFGIPDAVGDLAVLALAAAVGAGALGIAPGRSGWLPAALVFALPAIEAAARLPNLHIARFHLATALGLALLLALTAGRVFSAPDSATPVSLRAARPAMAVLLLAMAVGTAATLMPFLALGRGGYARAAALMAAQGPATYTSNLYPETIRTLRYEAARLRLSLTERPADDCADPAQWYVLVTDNRAPPPEPAGRAFGPPACPRHHDFVATFDYAGLSGLRWTLYRAARENGPALTLPTKSGS